MNYDCYWKDEHFQAVKFYENPITISYNEASVDCLWLAPTVNAFSSSRLKILKDSQLPTANYLTVQLVSWPATCQLQYSMLMSYYDCSALLSIDCTRHARSASEKSILILCSVRLFVKLAARIDWFLRYIHWDIGTSGLTLLFSFWYIFIFVSYLYSLVGVVALHSASIAKLCRRISVVLLSNINN